MIYSGIAPLDELLGGIFPGRLHLLTGGPGTGKTTACLQFLNAALLQGEGVGLITLDRASDLASHARSIGLDLEPPLRTGRLLLVRFSNAFTSLLESTMPDDLIEEFGRLLADVRPVRLVIDPVTPFLANRSASGSALTALAELIEQLRVTTIVTYPGDVATGYDARLDSVIQRAAALIHLARADSGTNRMHIVQARTNVAPSLPVGFTFKPGTGLVTVDQERKPRRGRLLRGGS
jgi:circadian clock protein KaiC